MAVPTVSDLVDVPPDQEHVVLLDADGAAIGTAPKAQAHHGNTQLHLAFSCYIFDDQHRLLVTQRALSKKVFPGVWTNSLCGHPALGESLAAAVHRRARQELDLELSGLRLVLPDFSYRAEMNGVVEHELCPVLVATPIGTPQPGPDEVAEVEWVPWVEFASAVRRGLRSVSPWCALQVAALDGLGPDPGGWPTGDPSRLPAALPGLG